MFGGLAAFGDELVCQGSPRFYVLADATARALETMLQSRDPKLVILEAQHNFIARIDSESLAKRGWNYYAAIFVDPEAGFGVGCHGSYYMTYPDIMPYLMNMTFVITADIFCSSRIVSVGMFAGLFRQ
jgi:hypothetical protein